MDETHSCTLPVGCALLLGERRSSRSVALSSSMLGGGMDASLQPCRVRLPALQLPRRDRYAHQASPSRQTRYVHLLMVKTRLCWWWHRKNNGITQPKNVPGPTPDDGVRFVRRYPTTPKENGYWPAQGRSRSQQLRNRY